MQSEAVWLRFLSHSSFALLRSTNAASQFVLVTFCTITQVLCLYLSSQEQSPFGRREEDFFVFLSRLIEKFRFNYGYRCNNQVVFCAINWNKELYNESSKENSKDKRLWGNGLTKKINKTFFYGGRRWSDVISLRFCLFF